MLEGCIGLSSVEITEFQMTLREGSSRNVFSIEANRRALENQASECKRLGEAPVDQTALQHVPALIEQRLELWMQMEVVRQGRALLNDPHERLVISRC